MTEATQLAFAPEEEAAVLRHMNGDHAADSLLMVRALGAQPGATDATATGVDKGGIDFLATVDGTQLTVRIPWAKELASRAEVRGEVVRLYNESCAALGIVPRGEASH